MHLSERGVVGHRLPIRRMWYKQHVLRLRNMNNHMSERQRSMRVKTEALSTIRVLDLGQDKKINFMITHVAKKNGIYS